MNPFVKGLWGHFRLAPSLGLMVIAVLLSEGGARTG